MSFIIRLHFCNILHLDNKKYAGLIAVIQTAHQFVDMLYSPFRGGIRKADDAVIFKGHSLSVQRESYLRLR